VSPNQTLVISYIGYKTREIARGQPDHHQRDADEENASLNEVVVVGYVCRRKLVTGATVEVKGDDIAKMNTTQVLGALQSQSPGVSIQAASGQPGVRLQVMIRRCRYQRQHTPLYVIDGVAGGDINSLNPADIERIDVLKDAASCAIYGSAAANGVILITTKQGQAGKVQVTYDGNIGWQNVYRMPQMLTAREYMKVQDLVRFNSGVDPYNWSQFFKGQEDLLAAYQAGSNPGTNWLDLLRNKNAVTTSHALNIAGGSDRSKFSIGTGYQYQDGVFGGDFAKSDFRRFTFRINSDHVVYRNSKGLDVVKVGENIYYRHRQNQGIQIGNQYSNEISNMLRANPLVPLYNGDGSFFSYNDLKNMGFFDFTSYAGNPIASMTYNQSANNKSGELWSQCHGFVEVQPIKGLTYRGQINYNQSTWTCVPTCLPIRSTTRAASHPQTRPPTRLARAGDGAPPTR
jgi:TonB-dependent SusC/RagA subfamily outer membrane receptor